MTLGSVLERLYGAVLSFLLAVPLTRPSTQNWVCQHQGRLIERVAREEGLGVVVCHCEDDGIVCTGKVSVHLVTID